MVLRKSFYIRWSVGRSPRVHEVNPGRDPSNGVVELLNSNENETFKVNLHRLKPYAVPFGPDKEELTLLEPQNVCNIGLGELSLT